MIIDIDWQSESDYYATHDLEPVGPVTRVDREIDMSDVDDIFAGRPLADRTRQKADVICKTTWPAT